MTYGVSFIEKPIKSAEQYKKVILLFDSLFPEHGNTLKSAYNLDGKTNFEHVSTGIAEISEEDYNSGSHVLVTPGFSIECPSEGGKGNIVMSLGGIVYELSKHNQDSPIVAKVVERETERNMLNENFSMKIEFYRVSNIGDLLDEYSLQKVDPDELKKEIMRCWNLQ